MPKAVVHHTPVSPFHNLSVGELVDQLGHVKAEAAEIKSREESLRAELIARKVSEAEGYLFRVTIGESLRQTLDANRVKQEMGENWYGARCNIGVATTVRITARTGIALAA
jgi:hypothetical protein